MDEVFAVLICLGLLAGLGFLLWKVYKAKERREREEAQRKHELKMSRRRAYIKAQLKLEKARMKHELQMSGQDKTAGRALKKTQLKLEKAKMDHALQMTGQDTTTDKAIKIIPEALKNISSLISSKRKDLPSPSGEQE